jgi:elongation factor Ts
LSVNASLVKKLRDITGSGFSICKEVLLESNGDLERAQDLLREKGQLIASKHFNRETFEGVVKTYIDHKKNIGVILEINCETDFVAKNEIFNNFIFEIAAKICDLELNTENIDEFLKSSWQENDATTTVSQILNQKIALIGENIIIRRIEKINAGENFLSSYVHSGGKIGVLLELNKNTNSDLDKDLCMQIAAMNPKFLSFENIPEDFIKKEKNILMQLAINEGKSPEIAKKMVEGKLKKTIKNLCLLDQEFIKESEISVKDYIENRDKNLKIIKFIRFKKGEQIDS